MILCAEVFCGSRRISERQTTGIRASQTIATFDSRTIRALGGRIVYPFVNTNSRVRNCMGENTTCGSSILDRIMVAKVDATPRC